MTLGAVQAGQSHGSLFQLLPRVPLLFVHLLWNILLHCMQLSGWSLTFAVAGRTLQEQKVHDQFLDDTDEDRISLLTCSMVFLLLAMWEAARGSIKYFTNQTAAVVPGVMMEEL